MDYFNLINSGEDDEKKKMLYDYLQTKSRPSLDPETTGKLQEQLQQSKRGYDAGTLLASLSDAASKVGTVGGQSARSNIIPQLNEATYASAQDSLKNLRTLKELEDKEARQDMRVQELATRQQDLANKQEIKRQELLAKQSGRAPSGGASASGAAKPPKLEYTPAERALDTAFGKEYNEYVAKGGYADVEKSIAQLEDAKQRLQQSDRISGPLVGSLPKWMADRVNPEATAVREQIEEVVQRNLRLVLGAQFTQAEGDRLIARAYNPALSEQENITRLDRLIKQIKDAADAKQRAASYFEQYGTLKGYSGQIPTIKDIEAGLEGGTPSATQPMAKPQAAGKQLAPNEVRRMVKGRSAIFDANTKQFLRYED